MELKVYIAGSHHDGMADEHGIQWKLVTGCLHKPRAIAVKAQLLDSVVIGISDGVAITIKDPESIAVYVCNTVTDAPE